MRDTFDPLTWKEAVSDLLYAWKMYFKRQLIYSRKAEKRAAASLRVLLVFLAAFLGLGASFWFITSKAYGQEELVLSGVNWFYILGKFFPIAIWSSLVSVFIRFARRRFLEFKYASDFMIALSGLIIMSPLIMVMGLLIKIDSPGPIFFKQERVGKKGRIFNIWKLRTMRVDAEIETGPVWAEVDDPRITRLGKFLRKSHIDEIPQLINILKGDMSLIGPRPERPVFVNKINGHVKHYNKRLKVRPGIAGLAQARYSYGASIKDAARKLKYDLLYIERMCWLLDMRILMWTVRKVLTGEGAR